MTQSTKEDLRSRHRVLIGYLRELSHSSRDDEQSSELLRLVGQADELEHVTDSLASAFQRIARRRLRNSVELSQSVVTELCELQESVSADLLASVAGRGVPIDLPEMLDARETALAERFAGHTDLDQYIVESGLREICARMTLAAQRLAIGGTS